MQDSATMAPSEASARSAYRLAAGRLITACDDLDGHLPPLDPAEGDTLETPPIFPVPRNIACAKCADELAQLETEEEQAEHSCTHHRADDTGVEDAERGSAKKLTVRRRHPNAGVIRQDLLKVDDKFDSFTVALSALASLLGQEDAAEFEDHLVLWTRYRRWLKDRADYTLELLEANNQNVNTGTQASGQSDNLISSGATIMMVDIPVNGTFAATDAAGQSLVTSQGGQNQILVGNTAASAGTGGIISTATQPAVPMPTGMNMTYTQGGSLPSTGVASSQCNTGTLQPLPTVTTGASYGGHDAVLEIAVVIMN